MALHFAPKHALKIYYSSVWEVQKDGIYSWPQNREQSSREHEGQRRIPSVLTQGKFLFLAP